MKFYSGFSLSNDQQLFTSLLKETEYTVAGFSYGAIKAFEEVLYSSKRVDTLQLFSPAFFQDKDEKFKRMQMMYINKDKQAYLGNFLSSCFKPCKIDENVVLQEGEAKDLDMLLYYEWTRENLKKVCDKGIEIEVYLGSEDQIIDVEKAKEFFLPYATTFLLNNAGHSLQTKN